MKNLVYLFATVFILLACERQAATSGSAVIRNDETTSASFKDLFNANDAEKIMGEASHLEDSATTRASDAINYSLTYKANALDENTAKTGAIYLLFQNYDRIASAQERYRFVKTANEKNGIEPLEGVGDEAYYHSDNQNFYFVMVRKGTKMLTMKVNKITSHTSKDEFNAIARRIAQTL